MKKQMKKTLSMMLSLAMIFTMLSGYHGKEVKAAVKTQCTTYKGTNIGRQDYTGKQDNYYPGPMHSYLVAQEDGSFMRVQYGANIDGLLVEYYDKDYNLTSTKMVDEELPIFGGFYATDDNYYVVTGQTNDDKNAQKDNLEVYRITKYDKQWNKKGYASLKGANTIDPFAAGSCRMDMSGKYLMIRTCHRMYADKNGTNHQANVTIQLDTEKMEITDSYTKVMNIDYGYVSHSFNQFIKVEDGHIISLDHGDANPRSIILLKYQTDMSNGKFTPTSSTPCIQIPVLEFKYMKDKDHNNPTGASVGGFEISNDHYLVSGNNVKLDENFDSYKTRNVFVAAVDKATSKVTTNYLTNYAEGEESTTTPQMVKISGSRFMVLWTKGDQVYYTLVNHQGEKVGEIHNFKGSLSDCQPIISGNKVVWYTWNNGDVVFYDVNTEDLDNYHVTEIHNGHQYEYDPSADTDDTITFKCKECGETKTEKKITLTGLYWRNSEATDTYYSSMGSRWNQKVGTTMTSLIRYTPTDSDANKELDITSSNEDIISIEKASGININLIAKKAGISTITIKPKYNPQNVYTYKVTAYDPLKLTSFEITNKTPQLDEKVTLSAKTQGGAGTLQYKFYEEDSNGNQTIIQNYKTSSTYEWTPSTLGKRTLYVEVKDTAGNVEKKEITDVTVTKKNAPKINDAEKSYCYTIGSGNQRIDLNDYLPEDIKNPTYDAKISNPSSANFVTEEKKEDTAYTYSVSKDGAVGDQAKIQFTVQSDNYKDITFNVNITLTDKLKVTPKEGSEPTIEGSNELTYGQRLSELQLNTTEAKFVAEDGTEVSGTLKFNEPDKIPEAGTRLARYTFTPEEEQYQEYTGTVDISVKRAKPQLTEATVDETVFSTGKYLKDLKIHPGKATVTYDGVEKEIKGSWKFETPNSQIRIGKRQQRLVFTPDDTTNYDSVIQKVYVTVNVKLQASKTEAVYGDTIDFNIDPETLDPTSEYTYKFYAVDENGYERTIQKYSSETTCQWKPTAAGTYTVYVKVNGQNCKASVENITIKKAKAPTVDDITKEYPYTSGSGFETINLKELLPEDITITDHQAKIEDEEQIIDQNGFSGNKYQYHVSPKGKIGDNATIQITVKSENYEDISFTIHIKLRDQIEIKPKQEPGTEIFYSDKLTYGNKVSYLGFKSTGIYLETTDGEKIYGSLEFKDKDKIPDAGTYNVRYIFTPQDNRYKVYEGSIEVVVAKQEPMLSGTEIENILYDPQKTIADVPMEKQAVAMIGDDIIPISGTWKIENEDQRLPLGKYEVTIEFTPDDTTHYESVTDTFNIETLIELKTDLQSKEAKVGDKIHVSADPKADNLQYKFYITDENGNSETIRDYSEDAECEWTTDKGGIFTIHVEAKDEADNVATAHTEEITVNKKEEVDPPKQDPTQGNPGSIEQQPTKEEANKQQPTSQKPENNTSIKNNMTANVNGLSYKVTKVENAKNAQVSITSLDKKKTSITIPDYITINGVKCKVTSIEKKALYKGKKLKKITIGKNVQIIADNAFNGCKNLKSITIKSTVLKKVGKNAIKDIHKKAVIKVPKKQYKQYKKLFSKKTGFKKPMKIKK